MLRELLLPFLLALILTAVQLTIIPFFEINLISPDLLLILLVYYSVQKGKIFGSVYGFVIGIIFDIASGGLLGVTMFSKSLAGFTAGFFYNENQIDENLRSIKFAFIILLTAAIDSFTRGILTTSIFEMNLFQLIFRNGIFPGLYSAVFAIPLILFKNWQGRNG